MEVPLAASDAPEYRPGEADRARGDRLRLAAVRTEHRPDARIRIAVELERSGNQYCGEAEGLGRGTVEIRLVAAATLEAVQQAVREETRGLRLVGTKSIRAFDADMILAGLRFRGEGGRPLVGAVPARGDPDHGAAAAVLDAVNRVLGEPD